MFRIKLAVVVVGCVLAYFGIQEYRVGSGTSREPTDVALADLEAGTALANNHVRIGEHIALYPAVVYEYEESKYSSTGPQSDSKVNHSYYPIVSLDHPFVAAVMRQDENFEFRNIAVMVKTKRFKTIGAIPADIVNETDVKGLVINRIGTLDDEEKRLVRESFPLVDLEKLLIVEQDREPTSLLASIGMIAGGVALSLVGVVLFFVGRVSA